jgi:uncharacterized protein YecT (DUF1311 family)
MRTMFLLSLAVALAVAPQEATPCKEARTTVELNNCFQRELDKEEHRLSSREAQVRGWLGKTGSARFDSAATVWRDYRERECRSAYYSYDGGTMAGQALLQCKIDLSRARRVFLGQLYRR